MDTTPAISVIIPVLNEEGAINDVIDRIFKENSGSGFEVIVVDGDAGGSTVSRIERKDVATLVAPCGRGPQMNAGAAAACGNILLFLHADTILPSRGLGEIEAIMKDQRFVGGSFDLGIASRRCIFRLIEKVASLRSRITRVPFGDQAIFIRRDHFKEIGGYRKIPIMEDVELMRRIRKDGGRIFIIPRKVVTSARRWEQEGALYCTLRNWFVLILYLLKVPPEKLVRYYQGCRANSSLLHYILSFRTGDRRCSKLDRRFTGFDVTRNDRCLIMLVKYPEKGKVKSRLAGSIGEKHALALYRSFVEDILSVHGRGCYQTVIAYDPPGSQAKVEGWLGSEWTLAEQSRGNLGERIENAFLEAFARDHRYAVVVASDNPDLPASFIDKAFDAVERDGSAIGPTRDGGFYLLGFRKDRFSKGVLDGIPWSSERACAAALENMRQRGCQTVILDEWYDIDTIEDLLAYYKRQAAANKGDSLTYAYLSGQWEAILKQHGPEHSDKENKP